jgi:hypothetical protein
VSLDANIPVQFDAVRNHSRNGIFEAAIENFMLVKATITYITLRIQQFWNHQDGQARQGDEIAKLNLQDLASIAVMRNEFVGARSHV